jgi:hypothetical protein
MLYTPALAHEFEGYNAHFDGIGIADVAPSVHFNGVHQAFVELKSQVSWRPAARGRIVGRQRCQSRLCRVPHTIPIHRPAASRR